MNLAALQSAPSVASAAHSTVEHGYNLILTSVTLGLILTLLNVVISRMIPRSATAHDPEAPSTPGAVLLNSSNIAFLCIGVTSVMILVASDLARAFAVAAAIALVRFRIKMSEGSGSSLFFAVIVGMACGVDQLRIATQLTLIFVTLQVLLVLLVNRLSKEKTASQESAPHPATASSEIPMTTIP
ncbi:hypothetical protein EBZ37_08815 [bacterium]|nr:hypothetical protein [bacterium]